MNLKQITSLLVLFAIASTVLIACGGGGGGGGGNTSGGLPVAPPPTCGAIVTPTSASEQAAPLIANGDPRILVPGTSVPYRGMGKRAHTNHLILASSLAAPATVPSGFSPSQVRKAYGVPDNAGSGAIAVVDAYDDPNALADFNVFSTQFGLPTETSANPTASTNAVFQVVYASGSQPTGNADWAEEISLDTQWTHAMAPGAKIYLVEAASASLTDLMSAINVAKALPGVRQVAMSFGVQFNSTTPETGCYYVDYNDTLSRPGVTFFASSGDTAGEHDFPALSSNVVAVGGTTLSVDGSGNWAAETVWNGTGGGDSTVEPRPTFQDSVFNVVGRFRGACDIAAEADPNTGVAVYDSVPDPAQSFAGGWAVFGGTSLSCQLIAGIANASGASHSSSPDQNATFYTGLGGTNFHDIKTGSSGTISAGTGFDFPTGVGTPNGTGGF